MSSEYRQTSDDVLLQGMRAGEESAMREFIDRYQALVLLQARRFRVAPEERQHWTAEALYDVALALIRSTRPAPSSLPGYLIAACRRKALMGERARRSRMVREAVIAGEVSGERILLPGCSEESLRQAAGMMRDVHPLPGVLERLIATLDEQLDTSERTLLSWMGQRVPYGTMAVWLGITRAAVIKRAMRLRVRLLGVALEFGEALAGPDRRELARFFRRTGVLDAIALARLENGDFTSGPPPDAPVPHRSAGDAEDS